MEGRTYELLLSPTQTNQAMQFAGTVRAVRNAALYQRSTPYRQQRRSIGYVAQAAEIKDLRHGFDWIAAAPQHCIQQSLRDLDQAFSAFFAGRSAYPKYHRRGMNDSLRAVASACGPVRKLNRKRATFHFPKLGDVKFRCSRPLGGEQRQATISRHAGKWFVSFCVNVPDWIGPSLPGVIGIDRGVIVAAMPSDGVPLDVPRPDACEARRRLRLERKLARQKLGSNRRERTRLRLARLRKRDADRRRDATHKWTSGVVSRCGTVAIEDLHTSKMTRSAKGTIEKPGKNVAAKSALNREILRSGWYEIEHQLGYKLARRNGELVKVNPAYTSQRCHACGYTSPENRENQAKFRCKACGHRDNADLNAAKNIRVAGLAISARGGFGIGQPMNCEPSIGLRYVA